MNASVPRESALAWVRKETGAARILAIRRLGRKSSPTHWAITLDLPERPRVVLRQATRGGREAALEVEREVAALGLLERAGFDAPRVVAADPRGDHCGVPSLLQTRLPGIRPSHDVIASGPYLDQVAAATLTLHRIPAGSGVVDYRPYHDLRDPQPPERSRNPDLWRRAFERVAEGPPSHRAVFIHRDLHPDNTLWHADRLTGIVDWHTASQGAAGVDLGHMRWNLVMSHDMAVADEYSRRYRALDATRDDHQPYWDLRTVVDLLPDLDPNEGHLAKLEPYVERALSRLQ